MKPSLRLLAAFTVLSCGTLSGCSGATEIVIVADSDLAVPAEIDEVAFEVVDAAGQRFTRVAPLTGQEAVELPATAVVLHGSGPLGPIAIEAIGRFGGAEVVRQRSVAWFIEGRSVLVAMDLSRTCRGVTCPPSATCVRGVCVEPPHVGSDGGTPRLDSGPPAVDAGPGSVDAGPPAVDSGPPCGSGCACVQSCEGGCECKEGCACELHCAPGADCTSGKCRDRGTTCTLSARGASNLSHTCERDAHCTIDARDVSNVDEITCKDASRCEVDCTGAGNCFVDCEGDAQCLVDCSGTSNCSISDCGELGDDEDDELRQCADGVLACRRACP